MAKDYLKALTFSALGVLTWGLSSCCTCPTNSKEAHIEAKYSVVKPQIRQTQLKEVIEDLLEKNPLNMYKSDLEKLISTEPSFLDSDTLTKLAQIHENAKTIHLYLYDNHRDVRFEHRLKALKSIETYKETSKLLQNTVDVIIKKGIDLKSEISGDYSAKELSSVLHGFRFYLGIVPNSDIIENVIIDALETLDSDRILGITQLYNTKISSFKSENNVSVQQVFYNHAREGKNTDNILSMLDNIDLDLHIDYDLYAEALGEFFYNRYHENGAIYAFARASDEKHMHRVAPDITYSNEFENIKEELAEEVNDSFSKNRYYWPLIAIVGANQYLNLGIDVKLSQKSIDYFKLLTNSFDDMMSNGRIDDLIYTYYKDIEVMNYSYKLFKDYTEINPTYWTESLIEEAGVNEWFGQIMDYKSFPRIKNIYQPDV